MKLLKNNILLVATTIIVIGCGGGGTENVITEPAYKLSENGDFIYEDAEDNSTKGWVKYINNGTEPTSIKNIYDENNKSQVIKISMTGREAGYILGAPSGEDAAWDNRESTKIKWNMKVDSVYTVYIRINTEQGKRLLYYTAAENNTSTDVNETKFYHPLGSESLDGQWHQYERDLQEDLKDYEPQNSIISVNAFTFRGSGSLDNIILLKKD